MASATMHTAGPWKLDPRMPNAVFAADGTGSKVAATTAGHVFPERSSEEAAANARLIAAAPELLEALVDLASLTERMATLHPSRDFREVLHDPAGLALRIRAAIARAEGGAT